MTIFQLFQTTNKQQQSINPSINLKSNKTYHYSLNQYSYQIPYQSLSLSLAVILFKLTFRIYYYLDYCDEKKRREKDN